jgi:hypothetical protein
MAGFEAIGMRLKVSHRGLTQETLHGVVDRHSAVRHVRFALTAEQASAVFLLGIADWVPGQCLAVPRLA